MKAILSLLLCFLFSVTITAQETVVNILSYNVRNCIGMDGKRDYQRIADLILQAAPDVVALQELDSVSTRNEGVYALGKLEQLTGMYGTYAAAIPFQGGSYGIGILSKEKPIRYRIVPMPGREEKRTLLIAEYKNYVFCNTHQSLTPEDQVLAVQLIEKNVKGIRKPVFLAGDMNSQPSNRPQQMLSKFFTVLNDTAVHTYPADQPSACIDYIYAYSQNGYEFEVEKQKVIPEKVASDHRPVQVRVHVNSRTRHPAKK